MKFRTRAQQAQIDKPSRKAIRAAIASMAPLDMPQPDLAKKQPRRKLVEDEMPDVFADLPAGEEY